VRLLTIVEQTPEVALAAARRRSAIFGWIEQGWVHYACVHPASREVWMFEDGEMRPLAALPAPTQQFASSLDAAAQGRDNLPPSFIVPEPA
jgi:hypothetical protein